MIYQKITLVFAYSSVYTILIMAICGLTIIGAAIILYILVCLVCNSKRLWYSKKKKNSLTLNFYISYLENTIHDISIL